MGKMYYSEQEAAEKLGVTPEQMQGLVDEGKLRVFQDGSRRMYRADEVDGLAPKEPAEIELTAADSGTPEQDEVTLSAADSAAEPPGKEDTVISTEGISVFDDEDLDIETADPMAKTTIAPSVGEEVGAEGGGSGLMDLTREPDDTSLGAVLEDINVESAVGSSAAVEAIGEEQAYAEPEPVVERTVAVEVMDASSGAFSGLVVAVCLVTLVLGTVAVPTMMQAMPRYLEALQQNLLIFMAIAGAVFLILAVVGYFIGKSATTRSSAQKKGSET